MFEGVFGIMKFFNKLFDRWNSVFLLAVLLFLTGTLSCKKRRFQVSRSLVAPSLATASVLKADMDGYASVNSTTQGPGDVVFEVTVVDSGNSTNFTNLEVSLDASDSQFFRTNKLRLKASLELVRGGAGSTLINRQDVESSDSNWAVSTNQVFFNGDIFRVTIHDVPAALKGSGVYLYSNVRRSSPESVSNFLDSQGSWGSQESLFASSDIAAKKVGADSAPADLYNFSGNLSLMSVTLDASGKAAFRGSGAGSQSNQCGDLKLNVEMKANFFSGGATQSFPLEENKDASGTTVPDPCQVARNVTVDADAGPIGIQSALSGLGGQGAFVEAQYAIGTVDSVRGQASLGKDTLVTLNEPGSYNYRNYVARHKKGNSYSFVILGVNQLIGMQIAQAYVSLFFPSNTSAAVSKFDGQGLRLVLQDSSGNALKDSSGTPVGEISTNSADRNAVSFDPLAFPDLPSGTYRLMLVVPDSIGDGAVISVSLAVEKLKSVAEELNPNVLEDFKLRDQKSGAAVHSWSQVDYDDPSREKRKPVALVEVLRHMEEIRDAYLVGLNARNPFTGKIPETTSQNQVTLDAVSNCLSNPAHHWSDLSLHYYCLYPMVGVRECYTDAIRDTGPYMAQVSIEEQAKGYTGLTLGGASACRMPVMPEGWDPTTPAVLANGPTLTVPVLPKDLIGKFATLRRYAYFTCSVPESIGLPNQTSPASALTGCRARKDIFAYAPAPEARSAFQWIVDRPAQSAAFRYLMESPTFAFDEKDQQDIVNHFWRVSQPDPSLPNSDCYKRPVRTIDPKDGTHCLPNAQEPKRGHKVQDPNQAAIGR